MSEPASEKNSPRYWYCGELIRSSTVLLSIQDPGLLYGATVFTTLRVYERNLDHPWTAWQAHLERTARSLQAFHWQQPDWQRIRQGAIALAEHYPVLRITLFPDGRELILGRSLPSNLAEIHRDGITAWVANSAEHRRELQAHKTGNYLGGWLALQAAKRVNAGEAVLENAEGHWLETSTGNLWGWAEGKWWTPPLAAGILPGVLRSRLIQGLEGYEPVQISPWTPEQVSQFTFLAYTNSVLEVVPIRRVLQGSSSVNYNSDYDKVQQLTRAWQSIH